MYTYTRNKNPNWPKKIDNLLFSTFKGNEYTAYGLKHEDEARKKYSEMSSVKIVKTGLIVHPEYPYLGFSPDGLIVTNNDKLRLLEIKCPVEGVTKTAVELAGHLDYVTIDDEFKYGLKSNHKYYGQIQLGLFFYWGLKHVILLFTVHMTVAFLRLLSPKIIIFLQK